MDVVEKLRWRYATKKFDAKKKLSGDQLGLLKKSFNLTPTSYGLEPLKLILISNDNLREELLEHSGNQRQVVTASHLLVLCIETKVDQNFIKTSFDRAQEIRQTPDEIIMPYKEFLLGFFEDMNAEEKEIWATNQVYLALGNLLTTCAAHQIDACPMEGFDAEAYDRVLKLKEKGLASKIILPVGFRAEDDQFAGFEKVRRPLDEVVIEID
jgi:hypothetical protein